MTERAVQLLAKFEAAFEIPELMKKLIRKAIQEHLTCPSDLAAYSSFETNCRLQLNALLRGSALSREEKRMARIALKGCLVLLAYEDHKAARSRILCNSSRMVSFYPEFATCTEFRLLLKFRNIIAVSLTLMGAENNKAKHLIIATGLSEGKQARYVTGSGQTEATSRRVLILTRESQLSQSPSTAAFAHSELTTAAVFGPELPLGEIAAATETRTELNSNDHAVLRSYILAEEGKGGNGAEDAINDVFSALLSATPPSSL